MRPPMAWGILIVPRWPLLDGGTTTALLIMTRTTPNRRIVKRYMVVLLTSQVLATYMDRKTFGKFQGVFSQVKLFTNFKENNYFLSAELNFKK